MEKFFNPRSIVVFGASDSPGNLGNGVLLNLAKFNWNGKRWGIGRKRCEIHNTQVLTSLDEVPEVPELAIVLTPAPTVPDVVEACGKRGIKRIIIESGGFAEWSAETIDLENRLRDSIARFEMRIMGPNCIGTINFPIGLVTSFGSREDFAEVGDVSVIAQSGGVFAWFGSLASDEGRGFNKGASIGNKLNVDEVDLLNYFADDPTTHTILMYLEDIRDGKRFFKAARACKKPIVVFKANRFPETGKIAASHTAALAANDQIVDAALRQAGVLRPQTVPELCCAIKGFALPPMRGNNLAIIGRSGGHAVIAADRAAYHKFNMIEFHDQTMRRIEKIIPTTRILRQNPLDIGDVFSLEVYAPLLDALLEASEFDGIVFIHTFPAKNEYESSRKLLKELVKICRQSEKPVALCYVAKNDQIVELKSEARYPLFSQPEDAIDALAATRNWWRQKN